MKDGRKTPKQNLNYLPKRAEEIQRKIAEFNQSHQLNADPASMDSQRLIEELQLYQIELEMQNEQLRLVTDELAQTSARYENLYDFAPIGYLTLDEFGLILEVNLTAALFLNEDRRMVLKSRFSRFVAPEHFNLFTSFLSRLKTSDNKQSCELTLIRSDKKILEVRLEGLALMGHSPEMLQFRVAMLDISEQKAAQRKLTESREFVKKIADTMPDILTVYDVQTRKNLYGNREILSTLGLDPEIIKTTDVKQMVDLIHPDDLENFQNNMKATRQMRDGEIVEFDYRIKNIAGNYVWLHVRTVVFQRTSSGEVSQILSIQQNVTYKKEAEEALRYKDQIITGLQNNLPIIVSLIEPDGTIRDMAGSGISTLEKAGFNTIIGENTYKLFPGLETHFETVFNKKEKVNYQYCLHGAPETCFQNYLFLDSTQNAAVCFSIDISEQVASEKIIIAEREFSQSLLDNSVDGILAFDKACRFTAWNKTMEKNTSYKKENIIGKKIFDLFPAFSQTTAGKAVQKVLQGKSMVLYDQTFGANDAIYEVYLNPLYDEQANVIGGLCMLHNVKASKRQEAETTQLKLDQQKAILSAILVTQEEERRRIAESLHNGVGQLLYAAKLNLERLNTDQKTNNGNVALLGELLDEAIKETRTISFELMPSILEDFGLETALQELFKRINNPNLNLKLHVSGIKRLPAEIEISVYRIVQEIINNIIKHARATTANLEITCQNYRLQLSAKDNGIGFDPKSQLLKTKGIGLTSIQNRLKLLGGDMNIETAPGQGTLITIEIALPGKKR